MNDSTMARLSGGFGLAATGFLVAGPGVGGRPGTTAWLAGFVLVVASMATLASYLGTEGSAGRAPLLLSGDTVSLGLQQCAAGVGESANGVAHGSPVHQPLHSAESALFAASLLPLGIALAAAAWSMARRDRSVPRWLAAATGATSLVLIGNGLVIGPFLQFGVLLLAGADAGADDEAGRDQRHHAEDAQFPVRHRGAGFSGRHAESPMGRRLWRLVSCVPY